MSLPGPGDSYTIQTLGDMQFAICQLSGRKWVRRRFNGVLSEWLEIAESTEPEIKGKKIDFVVFDEATELQESQPKQTSKQIQLERLQAYKDKNWGEFA